MSNGSLFAREADLDGQLSRDGSQSRVENEATKEFLGRPCVAKPS